MLLFLLPLQQLQLTPVVQQQQLLLPSKVQFFKWHSVRDSCSNTRLLVAVGKRTQYLPTESVIDYALYQVAYNILILNEK